MTAATATRPLSCTTPTPAGLCLPCPVCGETSAAFSIRLSYLDGADAFACLACDEEFSFDRMRLMVNAWGAVLDRVGKMAALLSADLDAIGEDGLPVAESKE